MRTGSFMLFAALLLSAVAGTDTASAQTRMIPIPAHGRLIASNTQQTSCSWTVDGVAKGTSVTLDVSLYVDTHFVTCTKWDGSKASQSVVIKAGETLESVLDLVTLKGELVAVAIGGNCTFSVNGAMKTTGSQLKLQVPPGAYSVGCKPSNGGATKMRSVIVKSGQPAMAMFRLS